MSQIATMTVRWMARIARTHDPTGGIHDRRGIDVCIHHLREKIARSPERPDLLLTVRGVGYRLHRP